MKPPILEIVSDYILLRKSGKEYIGLCPFHDDRRPSLSVNPDKGLFHCFGCGESGDVIDFIMKLDGLSFPEARRALGMTAVREPRPRVKPSRKRAVALLAGWMNEQHLKIGVLCRELSSQIVLAERIPDPELVESLTHEWEILSDLHEDLQNRQYAGELWEALKSIEAITRWAEPEPLPEFPPLTPEYHEYLKAAVREEPC